MCAENGQRDHFNTQIAGICKCLNAFFHRLFSLVAGGGHDCHHIGTCQIFGRRLLTDKHQRSGDVHIVIGIIEYALLTDAVTDRNGHADEGNRCRFCFRRTFAFGGNGNDEVVVGFSVFFGPENDPAGFALAAHA